MTTPNTPKKLIFAPEIGGPMQFAFYKVLNIVQRKYIPMIQSNGGQVVEYSLKNEFTTVLAKHSKFDAKEIMFNLTYIKDCVKQKKTLPLESYRLGKPNGGCCYSKPFGSEQCMFVEHISKGVCIHKQAEADAELWDQIKDIRSLIFDKTTPKIKEEPVDEKTNVKQEVRERLEEVQEEQLVSSSSSKKNKKKTRKHKKNKLNVQQ